MLNRVKDAHHQEAMLSNLERGAGVLEEHLEVCLVPGTSFGGRLESCEKKRHG